DLLFDEKEPEGSSYRHKVQVVVSDVTRNQMLRLPMDARSAFGTDPDEMPIAEAVRMSMSIPFFFKPVLWPPGPDAHVLVDGGMLSNFPMETFDAPPDKLPEWPTFGLKLVSPRQTGGGL